MSLARRPFYPSFDGLRCLAIVPVVWHHATPRPLEGVLGRGPLGVDLFFVLSGFLITSLLLHERAAHGRVDLARFWVRRSLRIFPLYYLVLFAFIAHALLFRHESPERAHFLASVPYYTTYTSNWFVHGAVEHPVIFAFAWSLAAEEQFYLLWPPMLRSLRGRAAPLAMMLALVVLDQLAERGMLATLLGEGLGLRIVKSFATPIGLGSVLALLASSQERVMQCVLGQRWSSVIALGLVASAAVFAWPLLPTHLAMTALVGACALRSDHVLAPLLQHRIVRHVGTVSYGIYLLNVSVVSACRKVLGNEASASLVFLAAMLVSVAIATLTYRLIEKPLAELRERFRAPEPSRAPLADTITSREPT